MEELLKVNHLEVSFFTDLGESRAVKDASFVIGKGEVFGIVGESGSGKSVATKNILRLGPKNMKVKSGEILFKDKDILKLSMKELQNLRGSEISMVFQDSLSALNPVYPVGKKMVELLRLHNRNLSKTDAKKQVISLFESVGIVDPERCFKSYPHELSGGMRQRVGIAMAMIFSPKILLADEPTSALDVTTQAQIIRQIVDIRNEYNVAVIIVTHNIGVASYVSNKIMVMQGGRVVEYGKREDVIGNPQHEYTKQLLRAVPIIGGKCYYA